MNRIIAIDEWMKEVVHYCSDRYLDSTRNRITNTFKQTIIGIAFAIVLHTFNTFFLYDFLVLNVLIILIDFSWRQNDIEF